MKGTQDQFAYEWMIYREIVPLHREQFLGWIQPLTLEFFKGKRFLDVGCGIGRNSLWPLRAGASSGVAVDCDPRTVDVARFNLADHPRCEVLSRSVYDLDYKDEFDAVLCIGVLHHLAEPRLAVKKMAEALKPGGTLILWVYAKEGNRRYLLWFDPLRRWLSSRLPPGVNLGLAFIMTLALKAYVHLPHKNEYLRNLRSHTFRHTEAVVFDQLLPRIANYWTKGEALELLAKLPLRVKHVAHTNGVSWTIVAERARD